MGGRSYTVKLGSRLVELELITFDKDCLRARIDGEEIQAGCQVISPGLVRLDLAGRVAWVHLARMGRLWQAACAGCHLVIEPQFRRRRGAGGKLPAEVTPPMPATVVKVLARAGQRVAGGQALVVVSAMKMEVTLKAPRDGIVSQVAARVGDQVSPGQVLVSFEEERDAKE